MASADGVRDLSSAETCCMSGADGGHQHLGGVGPELVRVVHFAADLVDRCFCSGRIVDAVNVGNARIPLVCAGP